MNICSIFHKRKKGSDMEAIKITVQNLSSVVNDAQAAAIVRALNLQATSDYNGSCWVTQSLANSIASVTLLAKGAPIPTDTWHMELLDDSTEPGALGVHEDTLFDNTVNGAFSTESGPTAKPRKASTHSARGLRADNPELPLMRIFCKTAQQDGAAIGEVASHEMLEAAVDPFVMKVPRTVINPAKKQRVIVEVGDPVQETGYTIGGIEVANFALPAWFGYPQHINPQQMDFRGRLERPFELSPGGYISVTPEDSEAWTQVFGAHQPLI